jgi:hypothetical protein
VLGDDPFGKAVGAPAPTADALRRLVKLNTDARALQHLGAPESGKSGADHEDPWLIFHRAHSGQPTGSPRVDADKRTRGRS